ncbi:MAG: alpha/beta fold hydrolase [Pseudomonadales bacterium]
MLQPENHVDNRQPSPPHWVYSATEPARGAVEAASLATLFPWLLRAPVGDGHNIMVLPGFSASDWSTTLLRRYLTGLNYRSYGWALGRNTGRVSLQTQLVTQFLNRSEQAGKPITLIGQSLGGVFSRELARRFPERVRQVITLGSPFARRQAEVTRRGANDFGPGEAPPVPCTAIYSRFDGVVSWQTCMERERPNTSNIEVVASHIGMALHPAILHAIADRLAQPEQQWQKFDRNVGLRTWVYPKPTYAPG